MEIYLISQSSRKPRSIIHGEASAKVVAFDLRQNESSHNSRLTTSQHSTGMEPRLYYTT